MKSILQSLIDASKDRLKNPFVGSFIFAWMISNWEIMLILLFSSKNIEDKIKAINKFNEGYGALLPLLVYPFLFSVFYIVGLPFIMEKIEGLLGEVSKRRKKKLIEIRTHEMKEKQGLAKEENTLEIIKNKNLDIVELRKKNKELEDKVIELNLSIKASKKQNKNLKVINEELKTKITSLEKKLSNDLTDTTWKISEDDINNNRFSNFRISFKKDGTYNIVLGGGYNPAYNSCQSTTGKWKLSSDKSILTLSYNEFKSEVTVVGGTITDHLTLAWTAPHTDDEGKTAQTGCGDKTTPNRHYELTLAEQV